MKDHSPVKGDAASSFMFAATAGNSAEIHHVNALILHAKSKWRQAGATKSVDGGEGRRSETTTAIRARLKPAFFFFFLPFLFFLIPIH